MTFQWLTSPHVQAELPPLLDLPDVAGDGQGQGVRPVRRPPEAGADRVLLLDCQETGVRLVARREDLLLRLAVRVERPLLLKPRAESPPQLGPAVLVLVLVRRPATEPVFVDRDVR